MVPVSVQEAYKLARITAVHAAPIWGMSKEQLVSKCMRGNIPDAVLIGKQWWVTPQGMDSAVHGRPKDIIVNSIFVCKGCGGEFELLHNYFKYCTKCRDEAYKSSVKERAREVIRQKRNEERNQERYMEFVANWLDRSCTKMVRHIPILEMRKAGQTLESIATSRGICKQRVKQIMEEVTIEGSAWKKIEPGRRINFRLTKEIEMEKQFLSVKETSKLLSLSRTTLWRLEEQGAFPPRVQLTPGRVGYRSADVQAWIESRTNVRG